MAMRPAGDAQQQATDRREAVRLLKEALNFYTEDAYPVEWAMTQNNLGNAYCNLPSATPQEHADNLRESIDCFRNALTVRRADTSPIEYAQTKHNLAGAHVGLAEAEPGKRREHLTDALRHAEDALAVWDDPPIVQGVARLKELLTAAE